MTLSYYNARYRIGHLYPSGGLSDYEIQTMAPAGLQFLITRMPFATTSKEADLAIARDLEAQARLLADAKVDLIAFNCTAASLLLGPDTIRSRILAAAGTPSISTIEAVEAALAHFKPRKIALFTPYRAEVVEEEIHYLAKRGYEVVAQAHIPCLTPIEQGQLDPQLWVDLLGRTDLKDAEALLFSCAGICLSPVIETLERHSGLPLISSNGALLWAILQELGIEDHPQGYGRLLAGR